ncbi:MAG TPA: hypothetical protein VNL39_06160 [Xanthobacteraceae bacterium]|nr:hypothetical protein [Xanthobacteraceae bacterium]
MLAIIVYVAVVAVGEIIAFGLGVVIDRMVPDAWSMIIYMAMFFGVIWGAWPIAVYITERWLLRTSEQPPHSRRIH